MAKRSSHRKHNEIPLECDFWVDPKFSKVIAEQGWQGAGLVFAIAGLLWRDSENKINFCDIPQIAWTLRTETAILESIVQSAISSALFLADEFCFSCPFISNAAAEYKERIEKLKTNGNLGGRPKNNQLVTSGNQLVTSGNQLVTTRNQTQDKTTQDNQDNSIKAITGAHPLEKHFAPTTRAIERDPQFINAGRRPLKLFPDIWLTPVELEQVNACHKEHKVNQKKILEMVSARAKGRPPHERSKFCAYAALTGWALEEELKRQKVMNDLARSETYLAKAGAE